MIIARYIADYLVFILASMDVGVGARAGDERRENRRIDGLKIDVSEAGLLIVCAPRLCSRRKMAEEDISTEVERRKWLFHDDFQTG